MRIIEIIKNTGAEFPKGQSESINISGLCLDSNKTAPGFLFAALPGTKTHGIEFLQSALDKGAVAVLTDTAHAAKIQNKNILVLSSDNPAHALAKMAANFYPHHPKMIAAITGTNGKTSGTVFTRQIWQGLGHEAASIGTIGIIGKGWKMDSSLTTPDAIHFHATMQQLAERGVTHMAFEAGSHGLQQHRIDGVEADVAAFTNLTRDHLDYHGTMENYFQAKLRLFSDILKPSGTAVINRDIEYFAALENACKKRGARIISFGKNDADITILSMEPHHDHQIVQYRIMGKSYTVRLPLIGAFQAENIACAIGMVLGSGEKIENILPILEKLDGVPGRLQLVAKTSTGASVFVDYAHTPDAIDNVLKSLRPHCRNKMSIIFGCGGDRDPGKRPIMGEIAARMAENVIVTDDNPRTEDPAKIRAQIMAGCPGAQEIGDRAKAIEIAMQSLQSGDILVIAGKGHEQGQIVGKKILPFDDAQIARDVALRNKGIAA